MDMEEKTLRKLTFLFAFGCALSIGIAFLGYTLGYIFEFLVIPICIFAILANICVAMGMSGMYKPCQRE